MDEHFEKPYQVHVTGLMGRARKASHSGRVRLYVHDLRPGTKNAARVALQSRVEPNEFLMRAKNVAVEEKSDHLFADISEQLGSQLDAHSSILPQSPGTPFFRVPWKNSGDSLRLEGQPALDE